MKFKKIILFITLFCLLPCLSFAQKNKRQPNRSHSKLKLPQVDAKDKICFALYTVNKKILKLTAQLYEVKDNEEQIVRLEINRGGTWGKIAESKVIRPGFTANFRVEGWDDQQNHTYRVCHGKEAKYTGIIKANPIHKESIVVAAFTGNSINKRHGGDISRKDIIDNIKRIKPDLLFFSGDQVYNHREHTFFWLKFGRDFGEVIKDIPTICIPDDHDAGQANLWGASGKISNTGAGHDGGYFMPADYVKMVEQAQTSHLPDPYDPRPIKQGIGVYYSSLNIGGVDFAIIEDRKFKSGPQGLIPQQGPRPDHIRNPNYDPKSVDVDGATLLGKRQLDFLNQWSTEWQKTKMKCVLSQTIFCGGAHIHGKVGGRLHADLDSNGWPQSGRNRALASIRKGFSFMLAGDQHLGTIFHHGIDDWNDAGYSFCVPSIANLYLRWWSPLEPGKNRLPGMPEYTGELLDGFNNKLTCYAAANPSPKKNGGLLTTRAAGFGVVKFNKTKRTITMECWPRNVDITKPETRQYPGWPKTIHQYDNYGKKAVAYLPEIKVQGSTEPRIQVIAEKNNEVIYTLRIQGLSFRPKVFENGNYTLVIGEGTQQKVFRGLKAQKLNKAKPLIVRFDANAKELPVRVEKK